MQNISGIQASGIPLEGLTKSMTPSFTTAVLRVEI